MIVPRPWRLGPPPAVVAAMVVWLWLLRHLGPSTATFAAVVRCGTAHGPTPAALPGGSHRVPGGLGPKG